jgi:hypothetical protein
MLIVLTSRIVKGMGQLVCGDGSESTVFEMFWPFVVVERRLEDTSREDDLSIRGRVVGVDSLRVHFPRLSVSRLPQTGPCSLLFEESSVENTAKVVVG